MPRTDLPKQAQLERFAELVASSPHNLVSRRARDELWERHILECVAFARLLPDEPARVLDVGSGGGFPGMVVALLRPDLQVELLDATEKKAQFLRETAVALNASVVVHTGRAEDLALTGLGGSFDLVTARAVAPLDRLLGWTVPFLRPGGLLYAIKGARWRDELAAAGPALRRLRVTVVVTPESRDGEAAADGLPSPTVLVLRRETA